MVARLDEQLREDIEDMLIAIVSQDSQQLTSLVMRLGAVPPGLDEPALSVDLAEFVNHYANQPVDAFDLAGALTRNDRNRAAISHRAARHRSRCSSRC